MMATELYEIVSKETGEPLIEELREVPRENVCESLNAIYHTMRTQFKDTGVSVTMIIEFDRGLWELRLKGETECREEK